MKKLAVLFFAAGLLLGCNKINKLEEEADLKFGDQHFKSSVALIELYKVRHGHYPPVKDSIDFIGDWDKMYLMPVEYKRLPDGYELNLVRDFKGNDNIPDLKYPPAFWKGLGLKKSNLMPE
jgi:hypothetical protein